MSALSVKSSEYVGYTSHYAIKLTVEREATLTPNLAQIESRRLRGIYMEIGARGAQLSVEQAEDLRTALAEAISVAISVPDIEADE